MNYQWLPRWGLSEPSVPGHQGCCRLWWITSCSVSHHKWLSAHFPWCEVLIKAPQLCATRSQQGKTASVVFCVSHILTLSALSSADTGKEHAVPPSQTTQRRRLPAIHFPHRQPSHARCFLPCDSPRAAEIFWGRLESTQTPASLPASTHPSLNCSCQWGVTIVWCGGCWTHRWTSASDV